MQYICRDCGETFSVPDYADESFEHAFGTEKRIVTVCPYCGGDYEAALPCRKAKCGGSRRSDEILCADCRSDLLHRLCAFFDTLTAEEEEQVDAWLDGNSITSRKNWEV